MATSRVQSDGSVRVLILEDDPTIADILTRMLKSLTYQATWVKTGEEAIRACKDMATIGSFYNAALLDLTIVGGLGGREALQKMLEYDPKLIGIACSGYSDDELNKELLAEGFLGILPKPFKAQDLGRVLKELMGLESAAKPPSAPPSS